MLSWSRFSRREMSKTAEAVSRTSRRIKEICSLQWGGGRGASEREGFFYRNGGHFLDRIEELNWQWMFEWFILLLQRPYSPPSPTPSLCPPPS